MVFTAPAGAEDAAVGTESCLEPLCATAGGSLFGGRLCRLLGFERQNSWSKRRRRRRWLHCFVEEDEMHLDFSWAALKERSTGSEKPRAEGERGAKHGRKPMGNSGRCKKRRKYFSSMFLLFCKLPSLLPNFSADLLAKL